VSFWETVSSTVQAWPGGRVEFCALDATVELARCTAKTAAILLRALELNMGDVYARKVMRALSEIHASLPESQSPDRNWYVGAFLHGRHTPTRPDLSPIVDGYTVEAAKWRDAHGETPLPKKDVPGYSQRLVSILARGTKKARK